MCLRADWRPTVGRLMCTGGSALAEMLGELPAEEGEDGRPVAIACVEGAPVLEALAPCGAVTPEPLLLLRALSPTGLRRTVHRGHSA